MRFKFKFLAVAACVALGTLGIVISASAQMPLPPGMQIPIGNTGDYISPYMSVRAWTGYTKSDKYASGNVDENNNKVSDFDLKSGLIPAGTEIGIRFKKGRLSGDASINYGYDICKAAVPRDVGPECFGGVNYTFDSGLLFQVGRGADLHLTYRGAQIPWATVDDGFPEYGLGTPPQMSVSVGFKGAYIAIFEKGYNPFSSIDNTSKTSNIDGRGDVDYVIPRTIAGYALPGPISPGFCVMYQKKTLKNLHALTDVNGNGMADPGEPNYWFKSDDLVSWAVGLNLDMFMGQLFVHLHGFASQNIGDINMGPLGPLAGALIDKNSDPAGITRAKLTNTSYTSVNACTSYRLGDFEPRVGAGYRVIKNDNFEADDKQYTVYAVIAYYLTPGMSVQPGVEYINRMKGPDLNPSNLYADHKEGSVIKFGIFFEATIW